LLAANVFNAKYSDLGSSFPRLSARRSIPAAAFGLKEYFGWAWGTKMSDNVDTAASLGDSEMLAVQDSPRQTIPALGNRFEDDPHVLTFVRRQEARNILNNEPAGADRRSHPHEVKEQTTSLSLKARPFPCHR
jgi:preprotein translocase subunit SecD